MSRKKMRRIIIEAAAALILIFCLVFFLGFRVTKVKVEGNKYYTDKQMKAMVLDAPIAKNSILAVFTNTEEKTKDAELIDHVTVKRQNRNTIVLQVKEKELIGCIKFEGKYVNFDRQGIVQIITDSPIEDVPLIDGLKVKSAGKGEKLSGVNTRKLNTILSVGKMLEKTDRKPDRLVFNEMNQLVLYYDKVEVRMGDDESMDEKMNRLIGILPQLDGMEGILHLENVTEDTGSIVFDNADAASEKDTKEEDTKEAEGQTESSLTEDAQTDNIPEDGGSLELEYSDGEDSADTGSRKSAGE